GQPAVVSAGDPLASGLVSPTISRASGVRVACYTIGLPAPRESEPPMPTVTTDMKENCVGQVDRDLAATDETRRPEDHGSGLLRLSALGASGQGGSASHLGRRQRRLHQF